ncbi:hypothetical protein [Mangrovitalea sediminis]|uniref:hypothetical protein n=1 Tax=Mangrovitalea sediminis TaxID=1982043 RepID=UPI000BE61F48|nr:hypothetical protein [Mangrovitalea sediminis]
MQTLLARCCLLLTLALSQTVLAADDHAQCQEQTPKWVPAEYFGPGIIVHYQGHWFKSRLWQSGNEPGGTNMFAWEEVKAPPHCPAQEAAPAQATASSAAEPKNGMKSMPPKAIAPAAVPTPLPANTDQARREQEQRLKAQSAQEKQPVNMLEHALGLDKQDKPLTGKVCKQVTRWSFTDSYIIGSLVSFQGHFYRAIRPAAGQMPGKSVPPHWEPVNLPCPTR